MSGDGFMIYGATGYTGKLCARAAKARGMTPLLSGRSAEKLKPLAEELGFEWKSVDIDDAAGLDAALAGIGTVLHIAGPFSHTSRQMLDACIRNKAHYLDITGEISVLEAAAARDAEAKAAGIMVMCGVGFDVVPSDCLAAHMKARMPDATELTLAIGGLEKASRGTTKSAMESVRTPVKMRRGGKIVAHWPPPRRSFDFGQGPRESIAVAWGDVATAYHSTAIPDITVYFEATPQFEQMSKLPGPVRWLLSTGPLQAMLKKSVDRMPEGPTDAERAAGRGILLGEAVNARGERAVSRLTTPEGYTLTAMTGLEIVRRVQGGQAPAGFQTPSKVFGPDFILDFDGCLRQDLNAA